MRVLVTGGTRSIGSAAAHIDHGTANSWEGVA